MKNFKSLATSKESYLGTAKKVDRLCEICDQPLIALNIQNPSFSDGNIYECNHCKLAVTHPVPDAKELFDFYNTGFYDKRESSVFLNLLENSFEKILKEQEFRDSRALSQFNLIKKHFTLEKCTDFRKALDIGCSSGYLLVLLERHGFNVEGYEPDWKMAKLANKRLNKKEEIVRSDFLNPDNLEKNSYDLICSSHLLEHIPNPIVHLSKLRMALKRDGLLFLEVPNEYSMDIRRCLDPSINKQIVTHGHLFFYSRESISQLLQKCGFKIVSIKTCGLKTCEYLKPSSSSENFAGGNILSKIIHKGYKKFKKYVSPKSDSVPKKFKDVLDNYFDDSEEGIWIRIIASPA